MDEQATGHFLIGKNLPVEQLSWGTNIWHSSSADMVHASFNVSDQPAKLLAILGPCKGDAGYELEEVYESEPWSSLRK